MRKRHFECLVGIAAVSAAGLGTAVPSVSAAADGGHVVYPGQSIQAAVDSAKPGDTIVIRPGTYRESVLISTPGLTLRGSGDRTVIVPGTSRAQPDNACAKAGNGVCVLGTAQHTVHDVSVRSLTVAGFAKNGVWASWTDRLDIRDVTAGSNGTWGIAQQRSTRSGIRDNTAHDNGDAGIFVANSVDEEGGATNTLGTQIRGNTLTGNRIGLTARRVRNMTVRDNTFTANCSGLFVVGDEGTPKAGAMTIRSNRITGNNKFCAATARLPALQGSGIVLTGAESTEVRSNVIRDNVGATPLSGGVVLFKSFVGAKNTDNTISGNVVTGNRPADLANEDTGTGNTFTGNVCTTSAPAGMC
ncbi:right-handed parallel beta-helix repeat-containing protein [Streptomyces laculatispora]|uniref:Right-handed parallel beta-helix repeat-containing protein n=1 Tax=Streptomyces laculatispora TaxID=887464 RepID=A0ABY9IDL5_9ACTN|nr:right-handed parallel beta-helix repeat-containing protein [Streptomyces laculatispora]WLQ44977.1 right-handed parallel beta-helix repeat-containing protein [Streptomyces laculatispora]